MPKKSRKIGLSMLTIIFSLVLHLKKHLIEEKKYNLFLCTVLLQGQDNKFQQVN